MDVRTWIARMRASHDRADREEAARYAAMTPEERWRDVVAACDTVRFYWSLPGYAERLRSAEDALPESSRAALARLREEYRRSR